MDVDMDMQVDVEHVSNEKVYLWFLPGVGQNSTFRVQLSNLNLKRLTLDSFKQLIVEKQPCLLADGIDILFNGKLLSGDESSTMESYNVKPNSVLNIVKKFEHGEKPLVVGSDRKQFTPEYLHQITIALRTGFLSPAFGKTIEKLTDSDMLENLFAIAPGLATDLVGIGIIQSPHMIFHMSEPESLKKLAEERPWVVDAFNFIGAAIHQEKGTSAPQIPHNLMISQLLNPAVADEEMDEDEDEEPSPAAGASRSQSQPNVITREQLAQALSSLPSPGASPRGSARPSGGPFASLFGNSPGSRPSTAPASTLASSQSATAPNVQNLLQAAMAAAAAGSGGVQLTHESVSSAMQDALSRLPPDQRASQLNALRDLALQLTGAPTPTTNLAPVPDPQSRISEYQVQLGQLQEMGLTNERLCLLALRVSGGDVETAAELLFSGWDGAGADPDGMNPD